MVGTFPRTILRVVDIYLFCGAGVDLLPRGLLSLGWKGQKRKMKGIFLTIEGLDGAGKTTQLELLRDWFRKRGYDPLFTREPGGTRVGDGVRELLLNRDYTGLVPLAEAFLYSASRAQLVAEVIVPALLAGRIVVCDRFVDSSIAYQGYGRGLPRDFVEGINRRATGDLKPHLTLLLDLEPGLRLERLEQQGEPPRDRLEVEGDAFYTRVREGYLELARENPRRIRVISARQSIMAVHGQIVQYVAEFLSGSAPRPREKAGRAKSPRPGGRFLG